MDTAKIPKDHPMYDTGIVNIANEEHLIAILDDAPPVHAKDNGLAESTFFSSLFGTSREEKIVNVEWPISQKVYSYPEKWQSRGLDDLGGEAAYVLEMLDCDTFQNPGM